MIETILCAVGLTFGLAILYAMYETSRQAQTDRETRAAAEDVVARAVAKFPDYANSDWVGGGDLVILPNPQLKRALIVCAEGAKEIPFEKFLSVDIEENGYSVATTRSRGGVGRAAMGGLIGGGAGAVIGALTARKITTENTMITEMNVTVTIDDVDFPRIALGVFAPHGLVQHLGPTEAAVYRQRAVELYNAFQPVFAPGRSAASGLVPV